MNDKPGIYRQSFEFETHFTQIPNRWLRDPNLSMKAKGLLVYLMSHEVGYHITLGQIERETNDGKTAIRSTIQELEDAGYLKTARTKDARGYNAGLSYVLQEPESENPKLENPTLENPTAYIEQNLNREYKYKEKLTSTQQAFDEFWGIYPNRKEKQAAKRAFAKAILVADPEKIIEGARRYRDDPNRDQAYTKHPTTWLNGGCWDDDPIPAKMSKAQMRDIETKEAGARFVAAFTQPEQKEIESDIKWGEML